MWLPQSFVLINSIPNPIGVSTLGGVSRKAPSFIFRSSTPTSLMGMAKIMCQAPLFFAEMLASSGIQLAIMFHLVITLCENGGTPKVMVRLEDTFVPLEVPHLVSEANCTEVSKVQLESWHVAMAKLRNLIARRAID